MVRALRIPAEADEPITELEVFKLEDYQAAVGGWIAPVDLPDLDVTIYVHEEGLIMRLPFNSRATFLWWHFVREARQKAMLVGPALVVGLPDRNGESTDVPAGAIELLSQSREHAVLLKVGDDPAWHTDTSGMLSSIVLPMAAGEPNWLLSAARYEDFFTASIWAMVLLERWDGVTDTKVVPVTDLPRHLHQALRPAKDAD